MALIYFQDMPAATFDALFERPPTEMHSGDRVGWVMHLRGVALSSDAFFPFRDSIDRAQQVPFPTSSTMYPFVTDR